MSIRFNVRPASRGLRFPALLRPRTSPDEAPALPRHLRRPGRVLLRGRPLDRARDGRDGDAADGAPRPRALPEVLARRQVDRVHRPVRRRRAGLRDPAEGGVPKQLTYYPASGPFAPRWGYDNQVYGLDAGRHAHPLPLACATATASAPPPLHRSREGGLPARCRCRLRRRRLLAGRQADRLLPALPRLPHVETVRGRLGAGPLRLRPRDEPREAVATTIRTERDPMWIGDAIYFASDRDGTLNLYAYDSKTDADTQLTPGRRGTSAGRAPTACPASSTSWTASCRCST